MNKFKAILRVYWRLLRFYFVLPGLFGLFIWLYIKDAHWIFGLAVFAAILWIYPFWWVVLKNAVRLWKKRGQ